MSGSNIIETLEKCLKKLDAGLPFETILAEVPLDQRDKLRELLLAALAAQPDSVRLRVPASAQVDSRRRMLARAQVLAQQREQSEQRFPALRAMLRILRTHLPSAAVILAMVLLLFIALRSVGALNNPPLTPQTGSGSEENSTGVSLTEQIDRAAAFDQDRAAGVAQMVKDGQSGAVRFASFLTPGPTKNEWKANGIKLSLSPQLEDQARTFSDEYIEIQGTLGADGVVQVESLQQRTISVEGVLQSIHDGSWQVDGLPVQITNETIVQGAPVIGERVSLEITRKENQTDVFAVWARLSSIHTALPVETTQPADVSTETVQPAASPTAKDSLPPPPERTPQPVTTRRGIKRLNPTATETTEMDNETSSGQAGDSSDDDHDEDPGREEKKDEDD